MSPLLTGPTGNVDALQGDRVLDAHKPSTRAHWCKGVLVLLALLASFAALQCSLPLSTVAKIGADEDFELSKVPLALHGYKLYTDVWSDQPPLYAFLLTTLAKRGSYSILYPRLLTVASALLLLAAFFAIAHRLGGLLVAILATIFLI